MSAMGEGLATEGTQDRDLSHVNALMHSVIMLIKKLISESPYRSAESGAASMSP